MWEFCVEASKQNVHLLEFIFASLSKNLKNVGGIGTVVCVDNTCCLVVACKKQFEDEIKQKLKVFLCDAICKQLKTDFLKANINFDFCGKLSEIFLKIFTYFDIETERSAVLKALFFSGKLNLESFFCFRLSFLKQKWIELCELANSNLQILQSDGLMELLKFLLSNLEPKTDILVLDFSKKRCFKQICNKQLEISSLKEEKMFVLNILVENFSNQTKIVGLKNKDLKAFLVELFDKKLEFC